MPKKILELQIDQIAFGGEALASHEGKKIFVPWGVPGDRVKIEIVEDRKDFSRGKILKVLEKSPHRTDPPCPYFFKCGGCQWQQIQYPSQLLFKEDLLKTVLGWIGKIQNPEIKPAIPAPQEFNYRNRIRLQVSRQGEVGFFRFHSKEVIPIEKCLIADEKINSKIDEARELAKNLLQKDPEKLHEIEIRIEDEKVMIEGDPTEESTFTQINPIQNEKLQKRVIEFLELQRNEKVLELFAGKGNFTFPLSPLTNSITAVESNSISITSAEEQTKKGHFKNIQWIEATSYRALQMLLEKNSSFDRVLLDPPRKGASEVLEGISKLKIPVVVYVSCDPSTLARDVQTLVKLGYRHDCSQVIDMFPQTYHIESITRLILG